MLAGLSQYLPESTLTLFDNLEFFVRLLLSAALGALVAAEGGGRPHPLHHRLHLRFVHDPVQVRLYGSGGHQRYPGR